MTVYTAPSCLFAIGTGLSLVFRSLHGTPSFEIDDGRPTIDGNETIARVLNLFEFDAVDAERVSDDVELQFTIGNATVEFVVGSYPTSPANSLYHGITANGRPST